jgi:hypothetical protein
MQFQATVRQAGKTATGIPVPDEVVEGLGAGKRPAVRVTVNGYTYRSTIASMGGEFMIPLAAEHRAASGVAGGQAVSVELELDTAPREVTVPADLATALEGDEEASRFFESLSYSQKRWYVLRIEGAKKAETRERRITDSVQMLREGRKP